MVGSASPLGNISFMMRKMGRIVDGLVRAESDAIDSLKYFSDHGFFAEALPKGPGETHISSVFLDGAQ